jgi:hypothetical protein
MPESKLLSREKAAWRRLDKERDRMSQKYQLTFTLLGAFGLVATFYGFERLIDEIPFLYDNPYILLGTGLVLLVLTGSLYRKLR